MKRILILAALLAAFFGLSALRPAQAQQQDTVITAQGNPYLVDFVARQSKRSDLNANVTRKGLDAAFSEWLAVEHPAAYRSAVQRVATRSTNSGAKTAVRTRHANGSCCVMASGCCSMCPSCCEQKSCTKSCCNLSACTTRPNCCK